MKKLRYFSTFTGIGGLDWGLEKLGAECVGFSEIRESSIKAYQGHYPGHRAFGDITKIVPRDLPDFDVFTGGFPCQSFSLAGKRGGFKDKRGHMIFYIADILAEKRPEFAALENVKGISTHDGGRTYRNVIKLLTSIGYKVRVVLLNSMHHGSAQARERVVFLCRLGKDFPAKAPEKRDDAARFRDVRQKGAEFKFMTPRVHARMLKGERRGFVLLGGWDRVNTLTTGESSSGRDRIYAQEPDGRFRTLTPVEAERLQGFPDGWTGGLSNANRFFALGNAVNCAVSEYLFTDYLKGIWW